jgi:3-oxoacyl-[acyl-carrier protein] reductase
MAEPRKVALVTGGRRGIGLGIARTLAADGANIVIADICEESEAADAIKELEALGARVLFVRTDISVDADRRTLMDAIRSDFGRLDALINNAGVAPTVRADILEAGEESFERLIRINLQGPYFLTQLAANWMIEQKRTNDAYTGSIVFVTSVSATTASVNRGDYCISKAALSMAVKLWAVRMAEFGVSVYEIRPGVIATDMTAGVKEKYDKMFAEGLALEARWGYPEDIGKAVTTLVRGDIPYATGQVINIDGGMTIQTL